jgi:hypothetical protein
MIDEDDDYEDDYEQQYLAQQKRLDLARKHPGSKSQLLEALANAKNVKPKVYPTVKKKVPDHRARRDAPLKFGG